MLDDFGSSCYGMKVTGSHSAVTVSAEPNLTCAMLCYAMLCYAMLCYAMLCYAMLCYAMLCYAMLCYATAPATAPARLHQNLIPSNLNKQTNKQTNNISVMCLFRIYPWACRPLSGSTKKLPLRTGGVLLTP